MSNTLTLAIERRWRLRPDLGWLVPLLLALHVTVLAGSFIGLALGYTLFLSHAGPALLPHVFFAAGVAIAVGMTVAELLTRWLSAGYVFLLMSGALVCAILAARLILPFNAVAGSFFIFVIAEVSFVLLVRRLRTIALLAFDEFEWGRLAGSFLPVQAAGGAVGVLLLIPFVLEGNYLGAVILWGLFALAAVVMMAVVVTKLPRRSSGATGVFDLPLSRWKGILTAFPVAGALVVLVVWFRVLRYAIQGNTLSFFGHHPEHLGLLMIGLVVANGLIVATMALVGERLTQRLGVAATGLIFSLIRLALVGAWFVVPVSWTLVILVSFSWMTMLPGLQFTFHRHALVLLPREVIGPVRTLFYIVGTAIGSFLGGLVLLFFPLPLDGRTAIGWTGVGMLMALGMTVWTALLLRSRWKAAFRDRGLGLEALEESSQSVPAQPKEIETLLGEHDPESLRIGFFLAGRAPNPARYAQLAQGALTRASTPACRSAALDYLRHVGSAQLAELLKSEVVQVRARALAAVALHRIPVGIAPITSCLRDDDTWVQLLACAAAWQLGMGKLAAAAWEGIDLSDIDEEGLLEFLEIIRRGAPTETLRVLKQLARFPSPRVREAAIHTLGLALQGVKKGHADLLEIGLMASQHEEPRIRAAAVDLLVASGADNSVEHIARLMEDPSDLVRHAAARGLSQLHLPGIDAASLLLTSPRPWHVEAAIRALAAAGKPGREVLDRWFQPRLEDFAASRKLPRCLMEEGGIWLPISRAMQNRQHRLIFYLVAALDAMGLEEASLTLEQLARPQLKEVRGQLCELIRRQAPRRYAAPILQVLSEQELIFTLSEPVEQELYTHHPLVLSYLEQGMKQAVDPYLQAGASLVWATIQGEELPQFPKEFPMNRLLFLKGVSYFEGLLLEELLVIDERLHQETYSKGETIFKEGSVGDRFYIIWEGSVDLLRGDHKIATLEQGAHFAEMALFEEEPRSATAFAATNCTLLSLEKHAFQTLVLQRPTILLHICKELSHRLRLATAAIV